MTTRPKLYIPDPSTSGGGNRKPPVFTYSGAGGFDEKDAPPPETRVWREYRIARLCMLLKRFCPPKVLRILLRWAEGEENFCSLSRLWSCDRRAAKYRVERGLEGVRGQWRRHVAEIAHTELRRGGEVLICPWLIQVLGCPHTHDTAAEAVYPGTGNVEATAAFVRDHQAVLWGGPPNAHLAVWYDAASNRTHVAVHVHRGYASVAQPIPARRRAA